MTEARLDHCGPLSKQQERVAASAREGGLELQCKILKVLVAVGNALDDPKERKIRCEIVTFTVHGFGVPLQNDFPNRSLIQSF